MNRLKGYIIALIKPRSISPANYRCYVVYNCSSLIGLIGHALFIPLFFILNVNFMAAFNVLSVITYIAVIVLNWEGRHNFSYTVCAVEVIVHAALAIVFLGWESGFHYYIFLIVPLAFYSTFKRITVKVLYALSVCISYVAVYVYSQFHMPIILLEKTMLQALSIGNSIITIFAFSLMAYYYSFAVVEAEKNLKKANRKLEYLAGTDPLTMLLNRRNMMKKIEIQKEQKEEVGKAFVLILCDIDNFKTWNDSYGHDCGDYILKSVSRLMKGLLRREDHIARWGGEEFLILLPDSDIKTGWVIAERMRDKICNSTFMYKGVKMGVTATFGVSEFDKGIDIASCILNADKALYEGKQKGKNCVVLAS